MIYWGVVLAGMWASAVGRTDLDRRAAAGAPEKVWVFFCDKGAGDLTACEMQRAASHLSPRAIERRSQRRAVPGLMDERDLPVDAADLDAVRATGVTLSHVSRWLNAVSVLATTAQQQALRDLQCVRALQPVRRLMRLDAIPARTAAAPPPSGTRAFYGYAQEQLDQIGVPLMHAAGFTGAGVVIGILDTGFRETHEVFLDAVHPLTVIAQYDFVAGDPNPQPEPQDNPDQHVHGTLILGTLAAYKPDVLVGSAYDAQFILTKTEDVTQEVQMEEDQYVSGLEFIEANGGDVATSSLGYIDWYTQADLDGGTAVTTVAVNTATENGLVCITAAGNGGHGGGASLIAPADALDVLTCGAVDSAGTIADFSSGGPTADGRVKPEVLARGVDTYTIWPYDDVSYAYASGTSLSTPLVAGAVALLVEAHPDWTVTQIRAALTLTASDYVANGQFDAGDVRGYGVINVWAASQFVFCPGDANGSGLTDLSDLGIVLANYGTQRTATYETGDLDGDHDVDLSDLGVVLSGYLLPCN